MISIIVIGKNEGLRLTKCLDSIYKIIDSSQIKFEVIYVDSNSTDDSIERALVYEKIKTFKVTGQCNAAVARNVGANESTGDILFFVDGDMEIQLDFFNYIFNEKNQLVSEYVTGHLDDYFYDDKGTFITKSPRTYTNIIPKDIEVLSENGGIFIITREKWIEVGGMNSKFKVNEDLDLAIRLRKKKVKIVRIPYLICLHHTIDYRNEKRMWNMLLSGYTLYPGIILREHLFDIYVLKRFIRSNYTAIFLLLAIIFYNSWAVLSVCIMVLVARSILHTLAIKGKSNKIKYFFERLIYQSLSDISIWIAFLFFFPKKITPQYKRI
jgi:glycosyltransferase involved in cell wall biosynthesis